MGYGDARGCPRGDAQGAPLGVHGHGGDAQGAPHGVHRHGGNGQGDGQGTPNFLLNRTPGVLIIEQKKGLADVDLTLQLSLVHPNSLAFMVLK